MKDYETLYVRAIDAGAVFASVAAIAGIATTRNTYAPLLLAAAVATAAAYVSMCDLVVRLLVPYVWEGPGGVFAKSIPCSNQ